MRGTEKRAPEQGLDRGALAFAAFAFNHAACDGVLEVRIGERSLLEWCPACVVMRVFISSEGRSRAPRA